MLVRAKEILDLEIKTLQNLSLKNNNIERAVDLLVNCKGKIIFIAMGKAGKVSDKIAATLSSTGTPAIYVNAAEAQHGDLGIVSADDVIIAMSNSGKTREVISTIMLSKKAFSCQIIGICSSVNTPMAEQCDFVIELGTITEACPFGLAPTCSTIAMMGIGDILSILTMEQKQFTKERYGLLHHSGYIGSVLKENT